MTARDLAFLLPLLPALVLLTRGPRTVGWIALLANALAFPRWPAGLATVALWPSRQRTRPQPLRGLALVAVGLAQWILFSDAFGYLARYAFDRATPLDALSAWLGASAFVWQLYFRLASYSLIAGGIGLVLGFSFPRNFRAPFQSETLAEFWQRWQITLSHWVRDFAYRPFALRARRQRRKAWFVAAFLATWACFAAWYGPRVTYFACFFWFGAWHLVEMRTHYPRRLPRFTRPIAVWAVMLVGWVFFRAGSPSEAIGIVRALVGLGAGAFNPSALYEDPRAVALAVVGVIYALAIEPRLDWYEAELPLPALGVAAGGALAIGVGLAARAIPFPADAFFSYRGQAFRRDELAGARRPGPEYADYLESLRARGVTVVVVPVPSEALAEKVPSRFGETLFESPRRIVLEPLASYRQLVEAAPSQTVDLLAELASYRREQADARFFTDATWSSLSMALAARAVARQLGVAAVIQRAPGEPDTYDLRGPALGNGRVFLAGGRHSRHLFDGEFSFGALLGRALGRHAFEIAEDSANALAPLTAIAEQGWIFERGDVLVWEFAANRAPEPGAAFPKLFPDEPLREISGRK